jgi:hypothetical protein
MIARESLSAFHLHTLFLGGAVVLLCAGCWEEIQYNPAESVEATLTDTRDSTNDLTTTQLFGSSDDANSPATESLETGQPQEDTDPIGASAPSQFVEQEPRESEVKTSDSAAPQDRTFPSNETDKGTFPPKERAEFTVAAERTAPDVDVMRPSRTALAAWRASSRWSLAAAIYAKGQAKDRYEDLLDEAAYAGNLVGVELPELPTGDGDELQSAVINYLLRDGNARFAEQLSAGYVPEFQALCKLAIKTHTLLLVYTPKSQQLDPVIAEIREAAENSGLPHMYWNEVVGMLERRAPFADVKQKVLAMHAEVGDYLAGNSGE